jgi:hypothetical protein
MKPLIFAAALLLASSSALAARAFWTGQQEQVQTVTYQWMWRCEYDYNGQIFYRLFRTSRPSYVQVQ